MWTPLQRRAAAHDAFDQVLVEAPRIAQIVAFINGPS
jgi:hypothetical protein